MRAIVVIAVVAIVLLLVGWLKYSSTNGDPTIQVDTEKIDKDTSAMLEKSKEVVDEAAKKLEEEIKVKNEQ